MPRNRTPYSAPSINRGYHGSGERTGLPLWPAYIGEVAKQKRWAGAERLADHSSCANFPEVFASSDQHSVSSKKMHCFAEQFSSSTAHLHPFATVSFYSSKLFLPEI